jgi:hypothetical protein
LGERAFSKPETAFFLLDAYPGAGISSSRNGK